MPQQAEIEDLKEETRRNIGSVKNHCPFNCSAEKLDEHGYCEHLVGFTNEERVGAPVDQLTVAPQTGMAMVNGRHARKEMVKFLGEEVPLPPPSKEIVLKDDVLVNPEEIQMVNGVRSVAKKWVSSRVYRKKADLKKAS